MSDRSTHHGHRHVCPAWCDRKNCVADAEVSYHTGADLSWSTANAEVEINLCRADEAHHPGFARTDISLRLTAPGTEDAAHVYLPPGEARTFARRLIALADLADATAVSGNQRW